MTPITITQTGFPKVTLNRVTKIMQPNRTTLTPYELLEMIIVAPNGNYISCLEEGLGIYRGMAERLQQKKAESAHDA